VCQPTEGEPMDDDDCDDLDADKDDGIDWGWNSPRDYT
jgi:hypothetical protein